jgi:DNA-directed RNA polymerase specialized sigma24 family protein
VKVDANAAKARVNMHPQPLEQASSLEQAASAFVELRPRLFGIAYRMLGSAAEAEDVLQEAWLRWQNTDRSTIANPSAFLATATTRLAINALQSARVRRKTYIGPWLPEPVDTSADNAVARQPAVGPTWNSRRCGAAVSPQAASASELLAPTNANHFGESVAFDPQHYTSLPAHAEFSFVYDAQQSFVVCVSDEDEIQQLRQAVSRTRADSPASSVGLMPTTP